MEISDIKHSYNFSIIQQAKDTFGGIFESARNVVPLFLEFF